jgi:serine protease Do
MKQKIQKQMSAMVCAVLLCMSLLCGTASAATLVVIDLADMVDEISPSVVEVFTETKQVSRWFQEYVTEGAGSGVVLSEDGYIVTNHHVIDGANTIKVRLSDGQTYTAALTGTDAKTDLAVLKINASGLAAAKLADSSAVQVGDFVIAIGNPLGELGGTVTEGIISAKDRKITIDGETMTLLQTSAAVNPGNSGGGLFDLNGELVGVVNAKSSGDDIEGLAFAIPVNTVKEITQELIQYGYVTGRPQLGISVAQITKPGMGWQTYYSTPGLYVTQSSTDNGLKAGDRIIQMDGTGINNAADVSTVLDQHSVGDVVKVVVSRSGKETTISVKLTEQKPT